MAFDVATIFSNCLWCRPEEQYFGFKCPACGDGSEVRVEGDFVLLGGPDGFPEPSFWEHARIRATGGITVLWEKYGATVATGERQWSFGTPYQHD